MIKQIPYAKQTIDAKDIQSVVKTLKSDWLTQGPKIEEFEDNIANYVGSRYAVAFNNATSALLASFFAIDIKKGDEVITSPYTFAASVNSFVWFGAKPVFVDIEENSFLIDPLEIEKLITKKTKAILAVDFGGLPCDYSVISKIAKKHKLLLIDDAAQSLGAIYRNKKIGTIADLTSFSFHPVKTITTGEGGIVTTNNKSFYERLKKFRNHGIIKDKQKLSRNDGPWYYEMIDLGLNLRLTDIQAALGISQLNRINRFLEKRRKIANLYIKEFQDLPILLPIEPIDTKGAWHLFPIRLNLNELKVSRRKIVEELKRFGIGVQIHFIPVHLHPYYKYHFKFKKGDFPNSEKAYEEEISLPLFPAMTGEQIDRVMSTFRKIIKKNQKKHSAKIKNINRDSLALEFDRIKKGRDPNITPDIEAVVVLSGESADPLLKTPLKDTEARTLKGVKVFQRITRIGGSPTLVLNGTKSQIKVMRRIAKAKGINNIDYIINPDVPFASTFTQIEGMRKLNYKKIAIATHAFHAMRTTINARAIFHPSVYFELFLIGRNEMSSMNVKNEVKKIQRYLK